MLDNSFFEECEKVTQALSNVLEIEIGESLKADLGLIGLYYDNLERSVQAQEVKWANFSLERLKRLLGELIAAKAFFEHQRSIFLSIVNELISDAPVNSLGVRAELMMLNLLLEDFYHDPDLSLDDIVKQESPDYLIKTSRGNVFLEVTHSHVQEAKEKSTGYKITRAIRAKSQKPYSNRETALFLDISNLIHREAESRRSIGGLIPYAEKTLAKSKFGAVVLMYGAFTKEGKYLPFYFTIIHEEAAQSLVSFLNRHYKNKLVEPGRKVYPMPTT